jgi:hypothetical protein
LRAANCGLDAPVVKPTPAGAFPPSGAEDEKTIRRRRRSIAGLIESKCDQFEPKRKMQGLELSIAEP